MAAKRKPRKFGTGGGTELTSPSGARYRLPMLDDEDIGGRKSKPPAVRTGEPSGGRLAKRGSTDVARPAGNKLPARSGELGDVDFGKWWKNTPESVKSLGRKAAIVAGATLIPDISRDAPSADKPRNYLGEGLQPAKKSENATAPAPKPAPKPASKPTEVKPVRAAAPSATSAKTVKANKPVTKVSTPTATKANARSSGSSRGASSSDGFMDDLRASARRMRDTSSEMAKKTGTMKEKLGDLSRSFKKGGSIKARGDGLAQRGKTKGRFV